MDDQDAIAVQFEQQRTRLCAVAYRMLGSPSEAEDAVQEAWLRLDRSGADTIDNLSGWLTTVVARVSLDMLKARNGRRENYAGSWLPEPIVTIETGPSPEHEAVIADSVGIALLVVLETLTPKERLAFVLHDMFGVSFAEIAPLVDRTPEAARKLASRARQRVRGAPAASTDLPGQRKLVDAFLSAAREGNFDGLLEVLDPDVVFNTDAGERSGRARRPIVGAQRVAEAAIDVGRPFLDLAHPAVVNGGAGLIVATHDRVIGVVGITVSDDRIVEVDLISDPEKLRRIKRPQAA